MRPLAAAIVVLLLAPASAGAARERTVEKDSATGDFATTLVSATVKRPKRIRVVVTGPGTGSLTWTILCSRRFSSSTRDGRLSDRPLPLTKTIAHPMLRTADSCIVSATGQLDAAGTITVAIRATRR